MKNIIVVSADHHGSCLLGARLDIESESITVTKLRENIITRDEIISQIGEVISDFAHLDGSSSSRVDYDFFLIDNEVLADYIGKKPVIGGQCRRPTKVTLLTNTKESLYKLSCAISEGRVNPEKWLDKIKLALSEENTPDRIEGHLVQVLAFAVDTSRHKHPPDYAKIARG